MEAKVAQSLHLTTWMSSDYTVPTMSNSMKLYSRFEKYKGVHVPLKCNRFGIIEPAIGCRSAGLKLSCTTQDSPGMMGSGKTTIDKILSEVDLESSHQNPSKPHHKTFKKTSVNPKSGVFTATVPAPLVTTDSGLLFRQKILYLKALKVNPTKALAKNPNFRSTSLQSLKSVENCLSSMGILRSEFGRIFDMYPQLLTCDPHNDLYPVFGFLLDNVGLGFFDIRKSIIRCPRLLICSVEDQLKPTLLFLRKLGFVGPNKITSQTTLLLVSSVNGTLMPKLDYLMGIGFEYEDVVNMVLRSPGLLTFSIENNYKPKVDYFLSGMKGDLADLKKFPQYFSYSLEGKIMRRHRLLADQGLSMPLWDMLKVSDGEFSARLIEARLRLGDNRRL